MTDPPRHRELWTDIEIITLKNLAGINMRTEEIAEQLKRTEDAIRSKAHEENISLAPRDINPLHQRK